jgi:Ca2+-transporting ATPase
VLYAIAFAIYEWQISDPNTSLAAAQTATANAIVFGQIFLLFNCRSQRYTMFKLGVFSNPWLLLGVVLMVLAQLLFTYAPVMNRIFSTDGIRLNDWAVIIGTSVAFYLVVEVIKRRLRLSSK